LEADGSKVECTLFGNFVDELNSFLAVGKHTNVVVLVHFGKVKSLQGNNLYNVQNYFNCIRITYNPDFEEAKNHRERMLDVMESPTRALSQLTYSSEFSVTKDFLDMVAMKTIEQFKEGNLGSSYLVYGTIKHIIDEQYWWYTAYGCNKSINPNEKKWFCEKCNRHISKVIPSFWIKVCVVDENNFVIFVIIDKETKQLSNMSCSNMCNVQENLPKQIVDLSNKSFVFKVEAKKQVNSRFEESFHVRRICYDASIIK
ncbi:hypothetical protein GYH30_006448, partial [Glycine max]